MADLPIMRIETLEALKKALFIQRQITRKAHDELHTIINDTMLDDSDPDPESVKKFMREEAELLASYAARPTLSEWAQIGSQIGDANQWGASFGVAILVGELILSQVSTLHPGYGVAIKGLFMNMLAIESRLHSTGDSSELDHLIMQFSVTKRDGTPVENEEVKRNIRKNLQDVFQSLIATCLGYGIFKEVPSRADTPGHALTPTGQRVLLHMTDIQKFVDAMAGAHARLQSQVPVLMNSLAENIEPIGIKKKRKKQLPPS